MNRAIVMAIFLLLIAAPALAQHHHEDWSSKQDWSSNQDWSANKQNQNRNRDYDSDRNKPGKDFDWGSGYNRYGYYNPFNDKSFEPRGDQRDQRYNGTPTHRYYQEKSRLRQNQEQYLPQHRQNRGRR